MNSKCQTPYLVIALALVITPLLFAEHTDAEHYLKPANSYTNLNPQPMLDDVDGRAFGDVLLEINLAAIGMPGDGYDNAGLTWDGQYLYLINMYDNWVYVIDPAGPSLIYNWPAAPSLSWGFGHEVNLWMTEYYSGFCYEYDWGGSATGNSFAIVGTWAADISEWYPSGSIWIIAVGGDNNVYNYSVPAGVVLGNISNSAWNYISQRGFSYDPWNDKFFIGGWNSNMIWELNNDGSPTGRQVTFNNVASLAYDWQSSIHPTPVLWCATNEATNRIFMLDADNSNPQQYTHDVGVDTIYAPAGNILPGVPINPEVCYRNYGDSAEVFDVYFEIDSSGTQVYYQTTNVSLAPGTDTTITWPLWTPWFAVSYDAWTYTALPGDENPANDTMVANFSVVWSYWKTYDNLPVPTYYNATATLDVIGIPKVYCISGTPTFTDIFEFDVPTETWSTYPGYLPVGVQRSAATAMNSKVYICCGADASFNALNTMQEFDPVTGTITLRANAPVAVAFNQAVAWNDTLVYVLGGENGSNYYNLVQIYDPATDSWTYGTPMPISNRSFAAGIFENNIYIAGGYNGAYVSSTWMGVINPSSPTNITWIALPDIPIGASGQPGRSRLAGACDAHGHFYIVGGDDHGLIGGDCYYYDPDDAIWHSAPYKPTPVSNGDFACFVNDLDGGTFFCAGGYNGSGGSTATEGLVNLGQYGIAELPGDIDLNRVGFASMENPVKGVADIVFTVAQQSHVTLKVFDRTGRMVKQLVDHQLPADTHIVTWHAKNVPAGVYFLVLTDGQCTSTAKLILMH